MDYLNWLPKFFTVSSLHKIDNKISNARITLNKKWLITLYLRPEFNWEIEKVNLYIHKEWINATNKTIKVKYVLNIKLKEDYNEINDIKNKQLYHLLDYWKNERLFNLDITTLFLWNVNESYKNKNDNTLKYMFQIDSNNDANEWIKWIIWNNLYAKWYFRKFNVSNFRKWYNSSYLYCY